MKRYLAFPAVAGMVWAQQAPVPGEAEKALLAQVNHYYSLIQERKFREAEKMVAEESRDDYYNGRKPDLRGFSVGKAEMTDNSHAMVMVRAKMLVLMIGRPEILDIPSPTFWKLEDGEWRWYIPESQKGLSPYGKMAVAPKEAAAKLDMKGMAPGTIESPDFAALQGQLKLDRSVVTFSRGESEQTFMVENGLPGPVDLAFDPHVKMIKGLSAELDKSHLGPGEKSVVRLRRSGEEAIHEEVSIFATPLNLSLSVRVEAR